MPPCSQKTVYRKWSWTRHLRKHVHAGRADGHTRPKKSIECSTVSVGVFSSDSYSRVIIEPLASIVRRLPSHLPFALLIGIFSLFLAKKTDLVETIMSPRDLPNMVDEPTETQYLYIIRHGDRWDYENPDWVEQSDRPGDPPLSTRGHRQARDTGKLLDDLLHQDGIAAENITWLSSPFLRTLQTSNEALNAMTKLENSHKLPIYPEYSIFEWDGKNGEWHKDLPPMTEREHYFPRLDVSYESLFVPEMPEPRAQFHARCERAMEEFHKRFPYRPQTAVVMVSHAAGCVNLCRVATKQSLSDITPAAPCSVYRLTRTSDTDVWNLDPHDLKGGMNGYSDHLDMKGGSTVPWNHFGDKSVHKGYTGPPTSRFAPEEVREQSKR